MKDIIFVLKTFVVTFILIVLMQIRVGNFTMEEQAAFFIQDSWMTTQVQQVAAGLSKVLKDVTGGFGKKVSSVFGGSSDSSSRSKWGFERSAGAKAAKEKSAEKGSVKEAIKQKAQDLDEEVSGYQINDESVRESAVN